MDILQLTRKAQRRRYIGTHHLIPEFNTSSENTMCYILNERSNKLRRAYSCQRDPIELARTSFLASTIRKLSKRISHEEGTLGECEQ